VLKSRAINNLGATEIPGAGVTVSADPYQPTTVRVDGKQLLVNGTPFTVKGVVYSPTPVGDDPDQAPFGDYFTNTYSGIHGRDLPVLRNLKANAVRLYHWEKTADHFDFLDQAYNEGVDPIYIIAGYWINEGLDIDPASSGNVREALKADFRKMVAAHKDHPAILMWSIGQNLNHPEAYGGSLPHLFSLINEMAETAHLEEGTKAHPVTTALADDRLAEILSQWESSVPSLDIWGANIYRGNSFGTLFSDINAASQKPLLILEYGIDAFDNNQGDEYEKTGTPVQADVAETLWKEIASNIQTCAGGALMAYSDEWWRGSACSINGNPAVQDACGYPTNSQPDGQVNEEWWGLVRIHDNGTDPDVVEPRAVYYRLQSLWAASAKSLTVVSPNGGELWQVGRPQTVRWNFQGTLGKTVKIEVLRNGKLFYTITKKAALGTAGVGTYTWTPPWKVRTGEDYQIRVAAIEDTAVTDISDGDFSIKSIWMVRN
jgi:hypothetical protein